MQIGINGPQNKDTKWSISGSGGESQGHGKPKLDLDA